MDKPSTWEQIGYTIVDALILVGLLSAALGLLILVLYAPWWIAAQGYRFWHWITRDRGKHEEAS